MGRVNEWLSIFYGLLLVLFCSVTGALRKLRRQEEGWRYHGRKKQ